MEKQSTDEVNSDRCSCLCCSCFPFLHRMPIKKQEVLPAKASIHKAPYVGDLPSDLKSGRVICITGKVLPNCLRFAINLRCGKSENDDIAFHFNPRLNERYVVRNCKINNHWGEEETTSIVKFDIKQYENFKINILIASEEFMVSLNGKHICAFGFRVPLQKVTRIEIRGLVETNSVEYKEVASYPDVIPASQFYRVPILEGDFVPKPTAELQMPLTAKLPKALEEGWQINIYGRVKLLPHSFYINLQQGCQIWPHPIIPLHVNPRFSTAAGENIFVRNAWYNGQWGPEERTPSFHFSPGSPFSVIIRKDMDFFSLWVDGNLTGEFRFRGPSENIDTVYVQGDVCIKHIVMEKRLTEIYFNTRNQRQRSEHN